MRAASEALAADLSPLVGGRASVDVADRVAYARDLWPRQQIVTRSGVAAPAPPAVIVWPESSAEVAAVVDYARERAIPVVPYGAGSGVCGGILPTPETILIDVKRMRRILAVDDDHLTVRAEAGIIGQHLEDGLAARGYTLGHFPSSIHCSTLGGWLAARSAGQCSGRYGKIEDMIVALTAVDGNGRVLCADLDRGLDPALIPLIVGSEGILAIITEATLRISPAPSSRRFASFLFDTTEAGLEVMRKIYQAGLRPAVSRLYDPFDTMMARRGGVKGVEAEEAKEEPWADADSNPVPHHPGPGSQRPGLGTRILARALRRPGALNRLIDAVPDRVFGGTLMVLVWEDDPDVSAVELALAAEIAEQGGGRDLGEAPARRWLAHRHSVSYRQSPMYAAGAFVDTMEVASTWSRLLPMYEAVRGALAPHVFVMAHFSHAYPDGASIYFTFAGSAPDDQTTLEVYDRTWRAALEAVVAAGGTLSHHHGVGRSKAPAMRAEQGIAVDVVRSLKDVFDPAAILNPGALIGALDPSRISEPGHGP
ncbi:MAG: FAD-binding oxidoreductase [Deltaproteobacteria bacterium]|nr:MAG: FAD-binding oxidoreductase [Deltaproteobacteria bacterium]